MNQPRLRRSIVASVLAFAFWLTSTTVRADEAMSFVYNAPESDLDVRYQYHWTILRAALERTAGSWGPFTLMPSERMSEARQTYELQHASGKITVMYLGQTAEMERTLAPVRIPVDLDLSGYFVFLIRSEAQPRFDTVHTLEDLKALRYGLGQDWIDVDIMRSQGFTVVTGAKYDGLFDMLIERRFDGFPRSAVEILGEFDARTTRMPDLAIERSLLFHYPLPMYFWFSATDGGRRLAKRAEEGMRAMLADGSYRRIFDRYFADGIARLRLGQRRLLSIPNPNLGPETPLQDRTLWFEPTAGGPPRP